MIKDIEKQVSEREQFLRSFVDVNDDIEAFKGSDMPSLFHLEMADLSITDICDQALEKETKPSTVGKTSLTQLRAAIIVLERLDIKMTIYPDTLSALRAVGWRKVHNLLRTTAVLDSESIFRGINSQGMTNELVQVIYDFFLESNQYIDGIKTQYDIANAKFGYDTKFANMPFFSIGTPRVSKQIDPSIWPYNSEEQNQLYTEMVYDLTPRSYKVLNQLPADSREPVEQEPALYPIDTLGHNVFTHTNPTYERTLWQKGLLPKHLSLQEISFMMRRNFKRERPIWLTEQKALRNNVTKSIYQTQKEKEKDDDEFNDTF